MQATEILVDFLAASLAAESPVAVLLSNRIIGTSPVDTGSILVTLSGSVAPPKPPATTLVLSASHKHE